MHDLTGNLAYYDFFRKTHAPLYFLCTDMSELGVSMPAPSFCAYLCRHLWFILVMLIQGFHSVEFYIAYGFLALFSIPGIFRLVAFYFFWSRAVSLQV